MALRSTNAFPEVTPVTCDLVSFASQRDKEDQSLKLHNFHISEVCDERNPIPADSSPVIPPYVLHLLLLMTI